MKNVYIIGLVVIVAAVAFWVLSADTEPDEPAHANIRVEQPEAQELVTSPLEIRGEARGVWYFEASFSVYIEDANGVGLGGHYATAQGDWMTEEFVPFSAELEFAEPTTDTGVLVLEKANPSGLPEHADSVRIPVRFSSN